MLEQREAMLSEILQLPTLDAHTHVDAGHLAARGLHDVLLYHGGIGAVQCGCPDGVRLSRSRTRPRSQSASSVPCPISPASKIPASFTFAKPSSGICTGGRRISPRKTGALCTASFRIGRRTPPGPGKSCAAPASGASPPSGGAARTAAPTTSCSTRWNGPFSRAANGDSSIPPCWSWRSPGTSRKPAHRCR